MRIDCRKVTFRYPAAENPVFEGLDQSFPACVTILKGYSGCGKSTLLRLAAGLLHPGGGTIAAEGLLPLGGKEFLRKELAMVFQDLNLLPLASVARNLRLACQFAGVPEASAHPWLERLGLDPLVGRPVEKLSGGQRQRVALARALAKNPKVLFLDEPTSGLDDDNTGIIRDVIRESARGRSTICAIATHDHRLFDLADELVDFRSLLSVAQ